MCKNDFTGYTCSPMTLADVEYFGDVDLPDNSAVVTGTYRSTHDYQMEAIIEVPLDSADQALTSLNQTFGDCISELPSPLSAKGIRKTCVMANDDVFSESEEPSSRALLDRHRRSQGRHTRHRNGDQVPLTAALDVVVRARIGGAKESSVTESGRLCRR